MRPEHQARQARAIALVAATDIADGIEMHNHPGIAHPAQQQIGGGAVLGGQEDPGQAFRRLGNRGEPVDARHDLIAERQF
jgi:hypothetical protein